MKQELNSQNNWIVISGVSRGLGLALSRQFLELGWCVAGLSSTASSDLEELKASFVDNFFWQQLDIGDSLTIYMFGYEVWGLIITRTDTHYQMSHYKSFSGPFEPFFTFVRILA